VAVNNGWGEVDHHRGRRAVAGKSVKPDGLPAGSLGGSGRAAKCFWAASKGRTELAMVLAKSSSGEIPLGYFHQLTPWVLEDITKAFGI